jgi:hypothetical protein
MYAVQLNWIVAACAMDTGIVWGWMSEFDARYHAGVESLRMHPDVILLPEFT